ncbi:hypothetical protein [Mycoplasma todarodis]|uniref:hypothetical protein n=1 Tax=Mycoplasma todarodis TaxID=1937191 RepID=UPI003B32A6E0
MFIIFPLLLIFSVLSINTISKKRIPHFFAFLVIFVTYTILTSMAASMHVSGIYSISVLLILFIVPIPFGIQRVIIEKKYKEWGKKILFIIPVTIIISLFFMLRPTNIWVGPDYRMYLPLVNSVSGKTNAGMDVNYSMYSKLSIYQFLGVYKWMSMVNVPVFVDCLVPIIIATLLSILILDFKRFRLFMILGVLTIFYINRLSNYLLYGSIFWGPLFMGAAILYCLKGEKMASSFAMVAAMYSATYTGIGVLTFTPLFIIFSVLREKTISLKSNLVYIATWILAIVISIVIAKSLNTYFMDIGLFLFALSIIGVLILKGDFSIKIDKYVEKVAIKTEKQILIAKIVMTIIMISIAFSYILIYNNVDNYYLGGGNIFYIFKTDKINLWTFVTTTAILNLIIIWTSNKILTPLLLISFVFVCFSGILFLSFVKITPSYVYVRLLKSGVTTASWITPMIIGFVLQTNKKIAESKKIYIYTEIIFDFILLSVLICFMISFQPTLAEIGKWHEGLSQAQKEYLSGKIYDDHIREKLKINE